VTPRTLAQPTTTLRGVPRGKLDRQPLEERFPSLARYVVTCAACGRRGRDANVDWVNFRPTGFGSWLTEAVSDWYPILPLDARGICDACVSAERKAGSRLA
jgi:hypothetical protein